MKLKSHIAFVHGEKKDFQCNPCQYSSSSAQRFKRHIEIVHEEKKPFKCNNLFQMSNKNLLRAKKALLQIHEGKKPFKCGTCGKNFAFGKTLKRHVQKVHERKNQPHGNR